MYTSPTQPTHRTRGRGRAVELTHRVAARREGSTDGGGGSDQSAKERVMSADAHMHGGGGNMNGGSHGESAVQRRRPQKTNSGGSDTSLNGSDGEHDPRSKMARTSSLGAIMGARRVAGALVHRKKGSPRSPETAEEKLNEIKKANKSLRRHSVDLERYKGDDKPSSFGRVSYGQSSASLPATAHQPPLQPWHQPSFAARLASHPARPLSRSLPFY